MSARAGGAPAASPPQASDTAHARSDALLEAERVMIVCNSCRYCEGLCAVFPAMELRTAFGRGDLNYLANLCHACSACYHDCQFAPPHEFAVNIPETLARVRNDSWRAYAWPPSFATIFDRNGLKIAIAAALGVAAFFLAFLAAAGPGEMLARQTGPGAFYRILPHQAMVALFGGAFLYAIVAIAMSVRGFLRDTRAPAGHVLESLAHAAGNALRLRYLHGGGAGCTNVSERPDDSRRFFHHLTFYGFLLCFASTCVATIYAYGFGRHAPYAWHEPPVVLGITGGIGLLAGPVGLFVARLRQDPALRDRARLDMDLAFIAMLFLTSLTGLLLLALRSTAALHPLLALHLGFVFAFFVTLPYGKFVHAAYRVAALQRYAKESRAPRASFGE